VLKPKFASRDGAICCDDGPLLLSGKLETVMRTFHRLEHRNQAIKRGVALSIGID
jgi:hypothetical protein